MNSKSESLFREAQSLLPGGVNSPVRAFRGVGGDPLFIDRAQGCYLFDADGRRYIDYIGSWGPMVLGHGHDAVLAAISDAVSRGVSYGAPNALEVDLAREVVRRVPSIEKVRFVNSGTEAVMSAVRLARAATGRNKIIKFSGCYHGHADSMLVSAGSGVATMGLPDSPGVTEGAAADTLIAPYNDLNAVRQIVANAGDGLAAIIVEPVAGNMGVVCPVDGFLQGLRDLATGCGALLIFDEVMTGFRLSRSGAQGVYDVTPDLTTLGKIIGGGLPVGAYGGRADLMEMVAPQGPVYQAGTLSGNPLAMAAGLATLSQLNDGAYERLENRSRRLQEGIFASLSTHGIRGTVQRAGSMLTLFFGRESVRDFEASKACDRERFAKFFHAMLKRGVHLPPSSMEAWFVSTAHDDQVIDETIAAVNESLQECAG
ncbi:MAG: glutamate-1-semialdehyde 2,1-aminomutase [Phycisphaerales bacterium]|nr:glutamate-1-semialdehyde 2,1-aminomutase [Phycisphaerales bacterium]